MAQEKRVDENSGTSGITIETGDSSIKKPEPKKENKPPIKPKEQDDKKSFGKRLKEVKAEFSKIVWPNKKELGKMTFTVIVTSLFVGAIIAGMDIVLRSVIGYLINLNLM